MERAGREPGLVGRLVGLTLLAALFVVGFGWLSLWQWDRAQTRDTPPPVDALSQPAVPLEQALGGTLAVPLGADARHVTASGTYERQQFVAPGRRLDGREGVYVLTPLRLADSPPDGSRLLVLRGFVPGDPSAEEVPPPPTGRVTVDGWLVASETIAAAPARYQVPGATNPDRGQVPEVSAIPLLDRLPYPLVDGYVGLATQQPALDGRLAPVPAPVRVAPPRWSVQSLSYAAQWLLFAGVVAWFWWRLVTEMWPGGRQATAGPRDGQDEDGDGEGGDPAASAAPASSAST